MLNFDWIDDFSEADVDAFLVYVESGQAAQEWEIACEEARWSLERLGRGEEPLCGQVPIPTEHEVRRPQSSRRQTPDVGV
jgi:hypothetical protein